MTINTTLMRSAWSIGVMPNLEGCADVEAFTVAPAPSRINNHVSHENIFGGTVVWKNTALADQVPCMALSSLHFRWLSLEG
jgi:hypothetical protein